MIEKKDVLRSCTVFTAFFLCQTVILYYVVCFSFLQNHFAEIVSFFFVGYQNILEHYTLYIMDKEVLTILLYKRRRRLRVTRE